MERVYFPSREHLQILNLAWHHSVTLAKQTLLWDSQALTYGELGAEYTSAFLAAGQDGPIILLLTEKQTDLLLETVERYRTRLQLDPRVPRETFDPVRDLERHIVRLFGRTARRATEG